MTRRVVETDVCIIGSGITAAMVAEKVASERRASIVVVEAGDDVPPMADRHARRQQFLDYGVNPWPADHLDDMAADGMQSRSMQVGGLAMHWGGVTPRFSPEDFRTRTLFGVGHDWPITYDDLDPHYHEAETRLGVAGETGPEHLDARHAPYPLPPLPLSYNLRELQGWGADAGIAFWSQPSAKNSVAYQGRPQCCRNDTCFPICPTGAKYTPDVTWSRLRRDGRIELHPRTLVTRLQVGEGTDRVEAAFAVARDRPEETVEYRAHTFVLAAGYLWSSYLLLVSRSSRFAEGLANRSGQVGRYVGGHRNVFAYVRLPRRLYPGINTSHSLVSTQFMRAQAMDRYLRHDFRIWESTFGAGPRLRDDAGALLLGDALLDDWRRRTRDGTARIRAYYDVLPSRDSRITLDPNRRTRTGAPLPRLTFRDSAESAELRAYSEATINARFDDLIRAGRGRVVSRGASDFQDHPAGGCRMGDDPDTSVCDHWGRTHDHENLFVVGAPTCVSMGCANGTLTFAALSLRSAEEIGRAFPDRIPSPPPRP